MGGWKEPGGSDNSGGSGHVVSLCIQISCDAFRAMVAHCAVTELGIWKAVAHALHPALGRPRDSLSMQWTDPVRPSVAARVGKQLYLAAFFW